MSKKTLIIEKTIDGVVQDGLSRHDVEGGFVRRGKLYDDQGNFIRGEQTQNVEDMSAAQHGAGSADCDDVDHSDEDSPCISPGGMPFVSMPIKVSGRRLHVDLEMFYNVEPADGGFSQSSAADPEREPEPSVHDVDFESNPVASYISQSSGEEGESSISSVVFEDGSHADISQFGLTQDGDIIQERESDLAHIDVERQTRGENSVGPANEGVHSTDVVVYVDGDNANPPGEVCYICLAPVEEDEWQYNFNTRMWARCQHNSHCHHECIREFLNHGHAIGQIPICPWCREPVMLSAPFRVYLCHRRGGHGCRSIPRTIYQNRRLVCKAFLVAIGLWFLIYISFAKYCLLRGSRPFLVTQKYNYSCSSHDGYIVVSHS